MRRPINSALALALSGLLVGSAHASWLFPGDPFSVAETHTFTGLQTFAAGILLGSDDTLSWGDAVGGGTADTILRRIAANNLRMSNGTANQIFEVMVFGAAGANNTILQMSGSAGNADITSLRDGGAGSANMRLVASNSITMQAGGAAALTISNTQIYPPDNNIDLGATGNRIQSYYAGTSYNLTGANLQAMSLKQLTELTTIAAAATTTTTIQIPANSLVLGVTARVTVIIPTAATFDIGVAGATTRYGSGVLVAAGTTNASPGTTNPTIYSAAVSLTITPNLTPANNSGRVRFTIHYLDLTPPTS